jgi:hypothetical protein
MIRYTARPKRRFGVDPLPSGYQDKISPQGLTVPSVGIEDVDRALFELFNSQIPFATAGENSDMKKVPVIFYAGEKWALNKRLRPVRDRNNSLVLPLITAVRTSIVQGAAEDISGRGINQQTGEIVVQRRLASSDRDYQNLVNRMLLQHQPNLAVSPSQADAGQLTTLREQGDLSADPTVLQGGVLLPNRRRNVYETIVVPSPQFFTAQYDVTFWTQYTTHMNQLLEQLISSALPQGNAWRIETPAGYWFVATVDANTYTAETNTDDYSQVERIIRYKFTVKVPGYILATAVPGAPVPIKRYLSAPNVEFNLGAGGSFVEGISTIDDPFLGADDPTLPLAAMDDAPPRRRDQRDTRSTRLYPNPTLTNVDDPALEELPRGTRPAQYRKE